MTLNNINNHHPHFTLSVKIAHLFLLFGNEEKLVALLVYSSFVRVPLVAPGMIPHSLVVVVFFAQTRSDSEITTARQSNSSSDVIRLVATEHVRDKY